MTIIIRMNKLAQLAPQARCTGCTACASVCAFEALEMRPDERGFLVPQIDESKCKNCGACAKVCPVLKARAPVAPRQVWIAKAKDAALRQTSASGGVFTILAHKILEDGGVVYGAGWDKGFTVSHQRATNASELEPLRGSKYVQSDVRGSFKAVKSDLASGKLVLFSGTPCQVAGLHAFLGKPYENLITAALICHSITSPDTWAWYLEDLRKSAKSEIVAINFRDKSDGKAGHLMSVKFADSSENQFGALWENPYARVYFSLLNTRESCFACSFRSNRCGADLVIGDFWTPDRNHIGFDDGKGVNAIIALSPRAEELVRVIDGLVLESRDYDQLVEGNPYLERSVDRRSFDSNRFLARYRKGSLTNAVNDALYGPWYRKAYRRLLLIVKSLIGSKL